VATGIPKASATSAGSQWSTSLNTYAAVVRGGNADHVWAMVAPSGNSSGGASWGAMASMRSRRTQREGRPDSCSSCHCRTARVIVPRATS
jgi:hypothetical protein